jgi:ABC-type branched-subunit amino acid transport system substrate-binding protein
VRIISAFSAALCVLCVLCVIVCFNAETAQTAQSTAGKTPYSHTASERRGKEIYLRGTSPSGREITAIVGDLDVPASTMTCGGCHGLRGEGKTEGGVTAGNLTWSNLIKTYGHKHPSGRNHGPFDEKLFTRSLVQGLDPAGNEMAVAMPRFKMSAEDMADLIAYLKRIEADRDPGLTESSVKVATILPKEGALAEIGAAMKDVLNAYFANVNDRGGIYNRSIELQTIETGPDAAATTANARTLIENGQVFAMVSGLSAGADKELTALTQEAEIPFMGPLTLLPQTDFQSNRNVFYLLPGANEQARALVNFAVGRPELRKSRLAIVHSQDELALAAADAIEDQARKKAWSSITRRAYSRERFDVAGIAESLKREGAKAVVFLGANGEESVFINAAAATNWTPDVFLLGPLTGGRLVETLPSSFKDRVFLSFSTVPGDVTPAGLTELRELQKKYKFETRHTASQLMAFAGAKIFTEALKRAGRDLSRERLVTALEGLYEYDTGVTPSITFGPNRRVGAMGAYVVSIDPAKREFISASGWVKNN